MDPRLEAIQIGDHVFVDKDRQACGAVREVAPDGRDEIAVYVENGGVFVVAVDAIRAAHDEKVILDMARLEPALLDAIGHAHDREVPGL